MSRDRACNSGRVADDPTWIANHVAALGDGDCRRVPTLLRRAVYLAAQDDAATLPSDHVDAALAHDHQHQTPGSRRSPTGPH